MRCLRIRSFRRLLQQSLRGTFLFPTAARYVPLPELALCLGTDDTASAYHISANAWPEYGLSGARLSGAVLVCRIRYFALRGFNVGIKSAPARLATLMRFL